MLHQQEAWDDWDVEEEWERDPTPRPPPQQQQQQQPPAPPPLHEEAPAPHEEAAAPDNVPIKEEEVGERKMDIGEPGRRCTQNMCRASFLFRTLSPCVSPAPSLRVQSVPHVLRAGPVHVHGDRLHVLRVLHSY